VHRLHPRFKRLLHRLFSLGEPAWAPPAVGSGGYFPLPFLLRLSPIAASSASVNVASFAATASLVIGAVVPVLKLYPSVRAVQVLQSPYPFAQMSPTTVPPFVPV